MVRIKHRAPPNDLILCWPGVFQSNGPYRPNLSSPLATEGSGGRAWLTLRGKRRLSDEGHRTNDRAVGLMHAARFGEDHHENVSSWCRLRHCCGLHLTSIRSSELPKRDLAGSLLRLRYLCEMSARVALRAGMTASRLDCRGHVIPALTDH